MPFYQYQGFDASGKAVQGTVQAGSVQEATEALVRQGFRLNSIQDKVSSSVGATQAAPQRPAPRPSQPMSPPPGTGGGVSVRPVSQRPQEAPSAMQMNVLAAPDKLGIKNTKRGSEKRLMLIFHQLASYFKAGMNPSQCFAELSRRPSSREYSESLMEVSKRVIEGGRISDVIECYPDLYPPHAVGIVRGGEVGGYMPEAMDSIAAQAEASYKFKRWFAWLGIISALSLATIFLTDAVKEGALGAWDVQEKTGGESPGMATFLSELWRVIKWPYGPLFIVIVLVCYVIGRFWISRPFRLMRHKLVLWTPAVRNRAKSESFGLFAWSLSMLSKGGAPPSVAWNLACHAMPNLALRQSLEAQHVVPGDTRRLSELLFSSNSLPEDFAPIVQTGEIAGDVPGALSQVSRTTQDEFKRQDQFGKVRVGCWLVLVGFIAAMAGFAQLYGGFYKGLMDRMGL